MRYVPAGGHFSDGVLQFNRDAMKGASVFEIENLLAIAANDRALARLNNLKHGDF
jgi:hypothetical protein